MRHTKKWFAAAVAVAVAMASCVPREPPSETKRTGGAGSQKLASRSVAAKTMASKSPAGARIEDKFQDTFARSQLGADWYARSSAWKVRDGQLCVQEARNQPIWLTRRLPTNARIEFDAVSHSPDGDIKVEIWGDGRSAAGGVSYTDATGYLAIWGGWKNRWHVLARLDEHGSDRKSIKLSPGSAEVTQRTVQANQVYHFRVERRDAQTVLWSVDGHEVLSFRDDSPLVGKGHEHLGFNNWQTEVCFDNLVIQALPD